MFYKYRKTKKGQYFINKDRFLFRLYGLHLDILAELNCLLFCLYCKLPSKSINSHSRVKQRM